jgi:thiosulfate dehydrogenase [quinone] large subunit
MWLAAGWQKATHPAWTGAEAGAEVIRMLSEVIAPSPGGFPAAQPWYATAAEHCGLPHAATIAHSLTYFEIALGFALLLGVFTTVMAGAGGLLSLVYLLGHSVGLHPFMYAAALVLLVNAPAAQYYGCDRHLLPWLTRTLRAGI